MGAARAAARPAPAAVGDGRVARWLGPARPGCGRPMSSPRWRPDWTASARRSKPLQPTRRPRRRGTSRHCHAETTHDTCSSRGATWRSGDAADCKSAHPGSIPGVASSQFFLRLQGPNGGSRSFPRRHSDTLFRQRPLVRSGLQPLAMHQPLVRGASAQRFGSPRIDADHLARLVAAQPNDLLVCQAGLAHFGHAALSETREAHRLRQTGMFPDAPS